MHGLKGSLARPSRYFCSTDAKLEPRSSRTCRSSSPSCVSTAFTWASVSWEAVVCAPALVAPAGAVAGGGKAVDVAWPETITQGATVVRLKSRAVNFIVTGEKARLSKRAVREVQWYLSARALASNNAYLCWFR